MPPQLPALFAEVDLFNSVKISMSRPPATSASSKIQKHMRITSSSVRNDVQDYHVVVPSSATDLTPDRPPAEVG